MKKVILAFVGKKWREWKCRVKKIGYIPFHNDADRLTHRPERVHEHQWRNLVYYWGTRKAQKVSNKNKEIWGKKTLNHITGKKPFSVVRVEQTNKKNGVPATRSEVWMAGYLKDNMPSNDKVAEVMTQMNELLAQSTATDEEIFTQVLGPERPGRVRTFGLGPSPTDVFGGGYRQSQEQTRIIQTQLQEQFSQHRVQLEMQMKEMMDAMRTEMQTTIQSQQTIIQAQQTRMEHLESQLQAMGGPVAPATMPLDPLHTRQVPDASSTHHNVHSHHSVPHPKQQSHMFVSSPSRHLSSQEIHSSKKGEKKKKKKKK